MPGAWRRLFRSDGLGNANSIEKETQVTITIYNKGAIPGQKSRHDASLILPQTVATPGGRQALHEDYNAEVDHS